MADTGKTEPAQNSQPPQPDSPDNNTFLQKIQGKDPEKPIDPHRPIRAGIPTPITRQRRPTIYPLNNSQPGIGEGMWTDPTNITGRTHSDTGGALPHPEWAGKENAQKNNFPWNKGHMQDAQFLGVPQQIDSYAQRRFDPPLAHSDNKIAGGRKGNNQRGHLSQGNGIQLQWWHELIAVLITALTISALVRHFLFQPFYIPSQSMENTLMVNDSILVTKMAPRYRKLNRGDIVVFKDAENWLDNEKEGVTHKRSKSGIMRTINKVLVIFGLAPDDTEGFLVKRVIGLPGDYVSCCGTDGKVSINGKSIDEGYLPPGTEPSEVEFQVLVPRGSIWVMGDNRQHSADSRHHQNSESKGFVPISNVVGRAFVMVWPPERIKIIANSCAFYNIPPPVSVGNRDSYSEIDDDNS